LAPAQEESPDGRELVSPNDSLAGLVYEQLDLVIDDLDETQVVRGAQAAEPNVKALHVCVQASSQFVFENVVTQVLPPFTADSRARNTKDSRLPNHRAVAGRSKQGRYR